MKRGPKPSGDPVCKMSVSPRASEGRAIREAAARAGKTLSRFFVDAALKEAALMNAQGELRARN